MSHIEIFGYLLAMIAVIAFLVLIFRRKPDIDFLQEEQSNGKITNSVMRLAFLVMIAYILFYITYQVFHKQPVDVVLVVTVAGIATGGKVGQKYLEAKSDPPTTPAP